MKEVVVDIIAAFTRTQIIRIKMFHVNTSGGRFHTAHQKVKFHYEITKKYPFMYFSTLYIYVLQYINGFIHLRSSDAREEANEMSGAQRVEKFFF